MTYEDIISDNCKNHSQVHWWPRFAYHYTDVSNAVSILHSEHLYSRVKATQLGLMQNDNASRQVINMTQTDALSCVRFYFRPLTPTQYYNEGFKHPQLRYDDDPFANIPVPVFFLFDLASILSIPSVRFSEIAQSGYGGRLYSGIEAFSHLNFDYIYSNRIEDIQTTKPYRHAEILHPNALPIEGLLDTILCRNEIERTTLLNMLYETDKHAFRKYQSIIKICKENMFEKNGFYLTDCRYINRSINLAFSDTRAKKRYTQRMREKKGDNPLDELELQIEMEWKNHREHIYQSSVIIPIDYENSSSVLITDIPSIPRATLLQIRVSIEDKTLCFVNQSLNSADLI